MLRINQLKMNIDHTEEELLDKICGILRVTVRDICSMELVRQSIDARKKPDILYIYTVDVTVKNEDRLLKALEKRKNIKEQISKVEPVKYHFPKSGEKHMPFRPVIVGMGPAGLFCGYFLAEQGYRPIILERGKRVEERRRDVEKFWETGVLDVSSNVQFGEGGAGTFSDGKLNTLVKDKDGRNRAVLEIFVKFGADESILYNSKPHIGTDVLSGVVRRMREEIIRLGGEVRFESQVTDVYIENGGIKGVQINGENNLECNVLVLAIGHSARDTFYMLEDHDVPMEAKAFAVGFRVQHPQSMINLSQYGAEDAGKLGSAPYKVTAKTSVGRGVYSFCMCPGGYVVNASSEEGRVAVNGMSYSGRDGENANSAIIVSVGPEDYPDAGPLSGIEFQRGLEERAYKAGRGMIPVQRYGDFVRSVMKSAASEDAVSCMENAGDIENASDLQIIPQCKGKYAWSDLKDILPDECNRAFIEGMKAFARQIKGFDRPDAVLAGVESRTSSPVRIPRDEELQSEIKGLYPCGEGAGYAGGITSAAMDGIRVAEKIALTYKQK